MIIIYYTEQRLAQGQKYEKTYENWTIILIMEPVNILAQLAEVVEYPDMTQNCICWWGFSPEVLQIKDYPFIAITPSSTLKRNTSTCQSFIYRSNTTI